ncbi:MAG: hypothetical protein GY808_18735 [Gammaproteobacteria bacterium]|nr:hypothetical protein [Gammaproteobacteria bacterium]
MARRFLISLFHTITCITLPLQAVVWTYTNTEEGINLKPLGYQVPIPINSLVPVDGFRSYESLHARHQDLMLLSDNITGQIIGSTQNGRSIWAYQLSDPDTLIDEGFLTEGATLQNGGIHAREWSTPEVTTAIIERFASNEADNWVYQYLLQNMNMIIIPVLNVDGYLQTQRYPDQTLKTTYSDDPSDWPRDGRMRRKNMRNVDEELSTTNDALWGIDLNRNHDPYWNSSNRSSPNGNSLVYHGSGSGSESETQALYAAAALGPANQLRFFVDSHSFSQLWYIGNTGISRSNSIASSVAQRMKAATNHSYTLVADSPGVGIGTTSEHFADTYKIPSYILETEPGGNGSVQYGGYGVSHSGFILPNSEIDRVRYELTNASVIAWYMQSVPPVVKAVEIRRVSDDTIVFSGQWQATSASNRDWVESINLGLSANEEFSIWVAYNKPMRWMDDNNNIMAFPNTSYSINPQFSIEGINVNNQGFVREFVGASSDWLTQPGGAGVGYLQYKTDAFQLTFNLNQGIDPANATLLALAFHNNDFAGINNDANPATMTDYYHYWVNFESSTGESSDSGGIDRTIRIINDGSPDYTDPNVVVIVDPPVVEPPQRESRGGSPTVGFLLILFMLCLNQVRRFRQ